MSRRWHSRLISPLFLWAGLGLVSIPILIHILNRRRFKVVPWAAMEFLLRAMKKNRRRLRFEQLILLATRCAVLLFARAGTFAAAGLPGQQRSPDLAGRRTGLHVLVIDNGYSMAYQAGPGRGEDATGSGQDHRQGADPTAFIGRANRWRSCRRRRRRGDHRFADLRS